jgi:hypothetical protein
MTSVFAIRRAEGVCLIPECTFVVLHASTSTFGYTTGHRLYQESKLEALA